MDIAIRFVFAESRKVLLQLLGFEPLDPHPPSPPSVPDSAAMGHLVAGDDATPEGDVDVTLMLCVLLFCAQRLHRRRRRDAVPTTGKYDDRWSKVCVWGGGGGGGGGIGGKGEAAASSGSLLGARGRRKPLGAPGTKQV